MPSSKRPSASGPGIVDDDERTMATVAPPPPPPSIDLAAGTMVGEYRVEAKIGSGGMGVVFSAVHPMIGKRAAIKILRQELCTDQHAVERFVDEARVVNQIGHPNIVDVFAFGVFDGRHYFVMEWLKGESLRARIARMRISLPELCAWIRPLTRALMAAHAQGVVHRDLKPDNVFLVEVGEDLPVVKLLDFGVAKLAHTDHRMEQTASGVLVGTPMYISPEQAKGIGVDTRSDVYALGVIMFEMVTGRPPFIAGSAMEVIAMHLMEHAPRPSMIVPGVPRELDELVVGMLAKNPAERPPLSRVCEVLDRVKIGAFELAPEPPTGPAMSTMAHVRAPAVAATMPSQPRRSLRWIALPLIALAGGAIAFAIVSSSSSPSGNAIAPAPIAAPKPAAIEPPKPAAIEPPKPAAVEETKPAAVETKPAVVETKATPAKPAVPKPIAKHVVRPKPTPTVTKPAAGSDSDSGELLFVPGDLTTPTKSHP